MNKSTFLTFIAILFLFSDCARNPVTGKSQVVLMSESQELAMGREADPQVVAQFGLYPDSALQQFIRQKGQEMAAISHRPNIQYQFRIVNSDVLNAFAIPGYVYFTRGIMGYFNNEAEFAGVLGHEIGHIAARHTVQQQRNATLGQIGIIAGMVISPQLAQFGQVASEGLSLLLLKNSRDAEREADRLGVEYSSKIGYDAQQMADFFNTLKRETTQSGGSTLPPFMSTHPDPGERNTTVSKLAAEWKQKLNLANAKVNRDSYLRRIEGLIYGSDPREGYLENSVFYHPELKFQFNVPIGWAYQNSPQQVQLAPQDGKALLIFMGAQGNSLQEAANTAIQQYKLQVVNSGQVSINGLPALAVVADQQQQDGSMLRTLSYFIQQNNSIYHLIGVAMASDYAHYEPYFSNTAQSFKTLTDPAKLNKQPEKIHIKTVNQATTLSQALRNFGIPEKRLEELAILNGMNLTDQLAAGELIKVVQ
jgi:predicted Zn-dependent protease